MSCTGGGGGELGRTPTLPVPGPSLPPTRPQAGSVRPGRSGEGAGERSCVAGLPWARGGPACPRVSRQQPCNQCDLWKTNGSPGCEHLGPRPGWSPRSWPPGACCWGPCSTWAGAQHPSAGLSPLQQAQHVVSKAPCTLARLFIYINRHLLSTYRASSA